MDPQYLACEDRAPDYQYRNHLEQILRQGEHTKHPFQNTGRRVLLTLPPMVFDLSNGFPLITERAMPFAKSLSPIKEMTAFIHGVRSLHEMQEWGCNFWNAQITPEKCALFDLDYDDMGDGSYGAAFAAPSFQFAGIRGGQSVYTKNPFNQFEHLVKQIKEMPFLSTHKLTTWIPHYCLQHSGLKRKVVVAPCHGDIQITILGKNMDLTMTQRSGDYPIGVPADIAMYAWLLIAMAHVTGYIPRQLIHRVVDAHIYENQIPNVEEMITRYGYRFPKLVMTDEGKEINDLFNFRASHFRIEEYKSYPAIAGIPFTD